MTPLTFLGRIARLQIQRAPLKTGQKPEQRYEPSALLAVETLTLTPQGAEARGPGGARLLDVHHARHPQTRQNDGENALSVGFTAHYARMRERFGEQVRLGCAGENILVETGETVAPEQAAGGFVVETAAGRRVRLGRVRVAAPCRPFTRYLLQPGAEPGRLKDGLQFLDGGLRGFYVSLLQAEPAVVSVGDTVYLAGR